MSFQIVEETFSDRQCILTVSGRLDAVTAPELKQRLKRLIMDGCTQLVVDLTDVPFIDSSGLAALVSGLKAAREAGGMIKLAGLSEHTRIAFEVTLLDRVFEFFPNVDAALRTLPVP